MFSSNTSQVSSDANWIEECFQTHLYTGNGSTQTITNGIDLSTKGGMVWLKSRSLSAVHTLVDTARGAGKTLFSDLTNAQATNNAVSAFNANGFTMGDYNNSSGDTFASWTFRKQPKFFDVVTYTGNGTNGRTVAHSLGSVPGCMIVKRTDASNGWAVYHRSMNASPQDYMMRLNATDAAFTTSPSRWNNTLPTATEFTLSGNDEVNGSGATYVAYLFAHNAGGFGLTGTDNVISCGSFTTDGSGNATVSLGYEPQWVVIKNTTSPENWFLNDIMRGMPAPPSGSGNNVNLFPNTSAAESIQGYDTSPTATGFAARTGNPSQTYIYIAIRRGPMKVPTSGTSVFKAQYGSSGSPSITTPFVVDSVIDGYLYGGYFGSQALSSRLTGSTYLASSSTAAESNSLSSYIKYDYSNGAITTINDSHILYAFARAPSFFDEVCYTGNNVYNRAIPHNLAAVPELVIVKNRTTGGSYWAVYTTTTGSSNLLKLNLTNASASNPYAWGSTAASSTNFYVGDDFNTNNLSDNFVMYLFATCPGVSKCFNYTGNGSSQTINCGFTGGARWILIKRTDSTGDWYVWDSARGIVSGNDPHLSLNSTAAEVTSDDTIDTDSTGFVVNQVSATNVNVSSATYIGIAIA